MRIFFKICLRLGDFFKIAAKTRSSTAFEEAAVSFGKQMDDYLKSSDIFKKAIASAVQSFISQSNRFS